MQPPLPAPTATGSFVKTPFPHLLVYALERRLTGTFVLTIGATTMATMVVVGGCPAKVSTHDPIHFLGNIMLELGMITPDQLRLSLDHMQQAHAAGQPRLQGQILVEIGATDPQRLEAGLRAQVERKVEHLFGLSNDAMFAYYDQLNFLEGYGGQPTAIDPFPVLWRGVRESAQWEHVDATLRRVGNALLRASATAQFERFAFSRQELDAVQRLRMQPLRMVDLTQLVGPKIGQVLVYLLLIMKQVDLIDGQAQAAPPQPPQQQRPSAPNAPPSSGQAFARVQLQRQQAARSAGGIVEEVVAPSAANDERASSPGMQAPRGAFGGGGGGAFGPPTGAFATPPSQPQMPAVQASAPAVIQAPAGPMDIGSMITATIQASAIPPPMNPMAPASPSMPAAPHVPESQSAMAAAAPESVPPASGGAPLTAEQTSMKQKIIDRAAQITSQDYFQMLGLDRDADAAAVQKAFFGLAKVWHPDRLPPALVDVKDACSKVFTHLTEAHTTLMDAGKRQDYMTLLKDGGATPEDQAKIQAILEAATEFQKAEFLLKRNPTDAQAYEIVKRCVSLDDEQADYLATLAWLDAQKPEWLSREKTLEKIIILDRCVQKNQNCERAYFYRGLLYKRVSESTKALKDFKKAAELNPRNLDAMREVRLHNIRGGVSKPPPGMPGGKPSKPPPNEGIGGLFGKLFKK